MAVPIPREATKSAPFGLCVSAPPVFEAPPDEMPALRDLVRHEMEHAATLSVPLLVDLGEGDNWVDTKMA